MESFIAVAGWSQHNSPPTSNGGGRPYGHFRSLSSIAKSSSPAPSKPPAKSPSTSELSAMAAGNGAVSPRSRPLPPSPGDAESELSTLPDPRSRSRTPSTALDSTESPHHPDLNAEVAALSTKLVNAINYQTTLDDSLSATKAELDKARETIKTLEERNATQREMLSGDVWVRKKSVEQERQKLLSRIAGEKRQREEVEKDKKRIEQELENLTTALFEEANKMVISAKEEAQKDHDAVQKKNDQLKAQLADTEALLKSQQEQLSELKHVMEQMALAQQEQAANTAPSSPDFPRPDYKADEKHAPELVPYSAVELSSPSYPTSFTHLIQPVLRTDSASYEDFTTLARLSRSQAGNRVSSGSLTGVQKLGLGLGHPSNNSTSSLPGSVTANSPQTPNTPASVASAGSTDSAQLPSLRETKFFKRVLTEDVEPTLRLDIAPGLSWLARRSVLSAMAEGTIVVEPIPSNSPYAAYIKPQTYPCSLCGDTRKDERYLRYHRFRTSESESASRYPLCKFCLSRVRSTCDFLSFLRILKDGHYRTDSEDAEKAAWEESVRLREQMFWARIGGGVVPVGQAVESENSARPSQDARSQRSVPEEVQPSPAVAETPTTPQAEAPQDGDAPLDVTVENAEKFTPQTAGKGDATVPIEQAEGGGEDEDHKNEDPKHLSITVPESDKTPS